MALVLSALKAFSLWITRASAGACLGTDLTLGGVLIFSAPLRMPGAAASPWLPVLCCGLGLVSWSPRGAYRSLLSNLAVEKLTNTFTQAWSVALRHTDGAC